MTKLLNIDDFSPKNILEMNAVSLDQLIEAGEKGECFLHTRIGHERGIEEGPMIIISLDNGEVQRGVVVQSTGDETVYETTFGEMPEHNAVWSGYESKNELRALMSPLTKKAYGHAVWDDTPITQFWTAPEEMVTLTPSQIAEARAVKARG